MSRVSFYTRPYDRLEPYDGKLSRTVLRGGAGSNASLLPDIRSEKDILKLVNVIIANTKGDGEKSSEDFWVKAERLLYCALIGYIWYEAEPEEKNFLTLLELINASEAREDDEEFQSPVDLLFAKLEKEHPDHFAVKQYRKFKLAAGKTLKSILISCGARLAPFDIAELREIMSDDELELDTLGDRKTALFLIMSDTDTTFNFVNVIICDPEDEYSPLVKRLGGQVIRLSPSSTDYRLAQEGLFKSVRIGNAIRIPKRSFDKWLEPLDL